MVGDDSFREEPPQGPWLQGTHGSALDLLSGLCLLGASGEGFIPRGHLACWPNATLLPGSFHFSETDPFPTPLTSLPAQPVTLS